MPRGERQGKGVVHVVADVRIEDERDHVARHPWSIACSPSPGYAVRTIRQSSDAGDSR